MKIACVGAGPAALYFSILAKKYFPESTIEVYEKRERSEAVGWGIILSAALLRILQVYDEDSFEEISAIKKEWNKVRVTHGNDSFCIDSQESYGISRSGFISILESRAEELGVELFRPRFIRSTESFAGYDLVVWANGASSEARNTLYGNNPEIIESKNRFMWLGCRNVSNDMSFLFIDTDYGSVWAHIYPFEETCSTFVVECSENTYNGLGWSETGISETLAHLQTLFSKNIPNLELLVQEDTVTWRRFGQVYSAKLHYGNQVVLGDAAHTAHFSIGSGTKIAIDDAIALAEAIKTKDSIAEALREFQRLRQESIYIVQESARKSMFWFEHIDQHIRLPFNDFTKSLLLRGVREPKMQKSNDKKVMDKV